MNQPNDIATASRFTPRHAALLCWLVVAIGYLISKWADISILKTLDPDDALRMVQVRDLLTGQPWWDVTQHRINPLGGGGLMHWSRLVDAPLAGGIALFTPLLGRDLAEQLVFALWPLLLLLPVFLVMTRASQRFGDRRISYAVPLFMATNIIILFQFAPVRIDHHGWQIMLSVAALALVARPPVARDGAIAGALCAALIAISLEGLPMLVLLAAIMAMEWVVRGERTALARLQAYLAALALSAIALQWATRGLSALVQHWCDGLSLPYLVALSVAAVTMAVAPQILVRRGGGSPLVRLLLLGGCGLLAGLSMIGVEPQCLSGPFGTLDPVVKTYWYANVREGRPIWVRIDAFTVASVIPSLVGLVGTILGWRSAADDATRRIWLIWLAALVGATILSILVIRTAPLAQLIAIPGSVMIGICSWTWGRSITSAPLRVLATLSSAMALPPIAAMAVVLPLQATSLIERQENEAEDRSLCVDQAAARALAGVDPALIYAPLDIGPHILQLSQHSVLATGHHRNNAIMARVIHGFLAPSDRAEKIVRATQAPLVAACIHAQEFANFNKTPGPSLAKDLAHGRTPPWLEPVPLGAGTGLKLWRVKPPASAQ